MPLLIQPIAAQQTHQLRHQILRPHQSLQEMEFPNDQAPYVFHLGAIQEGQIVGIVSVYPESQTGQIPSQDWRLRGMAVDLNLQGRGIGALLVKAVMDQCRTRGGGLLWCNARTPAVPFYEKLGFTKVGQEFEIEGIGPHFLAQILLQ